MATNNSIEQPGYTEIAITLFCWWKSVSTSPHVIMTLVSWTVPLEIKKKLLSFVNNSEFWVMAPFALATGAVLFMFLLRNQRDLPDQFNAKDPYAVTRKKNLERVMAIKKYQRANQTIRVRFLKDQVAAGVPKLGIHGLRHNFASHFVMRGGNIYDLKFLMGHSDIDTTMGDAHLCPEHLARKSEIVQFQIPRMADVVELKRLNHFSTIEPETKKKRAWGSLLKLYKYLESDLKLRMVPETGLEPAHLAALDPKS